LSDIAQAIGKSRNSVDEYRVYGNFIEPRGERRASSGSPGIRQVAAWHSRISGKISADAAP
jgi:hypothetical protein